MGLWFNSITCLVLVVSCQLGTISSFRHPHRHHHRRQNPIQGRTPATYFGTGMLFSPLPGQIVLGQCEWTMMKHTVENRIPQTIEETFCTNHEVVCAHNDAFRCGQVRSTMLVAYTDEHDQILYRRNLTISTGCACILRPSSRHPIWNMPITEWSEGKWVGIFPGGQRVST